MQICHTNELDRDDVIAIARLTISLLDQLPGSLSPEERFGEAERWAHQVSAPQPDPAS